MWSLARGPGSLVLGPWSGDRIVSFYVLDYPADSFPHKLPTKECDASAAEMAEPSVWKKPKEGTEEKNETEDKSKYAVSTKEPLA